MEIFSATKDSKKRFRVYKILKDLCVRIQMSTEETWRTLKVIKQLMSRLLYVSNNFSPSYMEYISKFSALTKKKKLKI